MRLLLLAIGAVAAVVAWLVWASSRDLREPRPLFPPRETDTWPPMTGKWVLPEVAVDEPPLEVTIRGNLFGTRQSTSHSTGGMG